MYKYICVPIYTHTRSVTCFAWQVDNLAQQLRNVIVCGIPSGASLTYASVHMYACMYVCIYVYLYIYTYIDIYASHIYMYIQICVYVYTRPVTRFAWQVDNLAQQLRNVIVCGIPSIKRAVIQTIEKKVRTTLILVNLSVCVTSRRVRLCETATIEKKVRTGPLTPMLAVTFIHKCQALHSWGGPQHCSVGGLPRIKRAASSPSRRGSADRYIYAKICIDIYVYMFLEPGA